MAMALPQKKQGQHTRSQVSAGDDRVNQKASWEVREQVQAFVTPLPRPLDSKGGESRPTENTSS